jgi:3-oxoacyl-[acyl-carrier protein] reductase
MPDYPLNSKVALITGAARGIGRECALTLAQRSYNIVINYRSSYDRAVETQKMVQNFGVQAFCVHADISDKLQVDNMVRAVLNEFAHIDVLVNNAGVSEIKPLRDIDEISWNRVIDVNLKGTFFCSQRVLEHMKERRRGRIINIASQAGQTGGYFIGAHYSASKAGVICLTKTLAKIGAPFGILVNSVSPGLIGTEMTDAYPKQLKDDLIKSIPLGRVGEPKEVANVVAFLASEEASYITGANIPVNGGMFMP